MPHKEKGWWLGIVVQCIVISSAVLGVGMWFVRQHDNALGDTFAKRIELQAIESRVHGLEIDQVDQNRSLTNIVHAFDMHLEKMEASSELRYQLLSAQVSNVVKLLEQHQTKISSLTEAYYGNQATGKAASH